jgi:hypothetical protein
MSRHSLVVAACALLPLSGCELFAVETDVPEMCINFKDRLLAGVHGGSEFERKVVADPLDSFSAYVALDAEITEARATLRAKSGVTSLAFLDTLSVTIRSVEFGGYTAPLSLVSCAEYSCASDSLEATLVSVPPDGIMDMVTQGQVELEVRMTGDLPDDDWVVDIEVCVSGKARAAIEL